MDFLTKNLVLFLLIEIPCFSWALILFMDAINTFGIRYHLTTILKINTFETASYIQSMSSNMTTFIIVAELYFAYMACQLIIYSITNLRPSMKENR